MQSLTFTANLTGRKLTYLYTEKCMNITGQSSLGCLAPCLKARWNWTLPDRKKQVFPCTLILAAPLKRQNLGLGSLGQDASVGSPPVSSEVPVCFLVGAERAYGLSSSQGP